MTSTASDPAHAPRSTFWLVVTIVTIGSVAPLVLYGALFGHIRTVTPHQAKDLLVGSGDSAVLVDVRPADVFEAGHIDGAVNWPLDDVLAIREAEEVPADLHDKTLLMICDVGRASRLATWRLDRLGAEGVLNVRGGNQEWIHSVAKPKDQRFHRWRTGPDSVGHFPQRQSPAWEQAIAVLAYFMIKPSYTILSLLLVILLWRSSSPDLAALRWGLIFFFLGENACAVNYAFFQEQSYLLEYMHSLGMLLGSSLAGVMMELAELRDAFSLGAAISVVGIIVFFGFTRTDALDLHKEDII